MPSLMSSNASLSSQTIEKEIRLRFIVTIQNISLKKTGLCPWGGEYSIGIERGTGLKKKAVASWTTPSNGSGHKEELTKSGDTQIFFFTPASTSSTQKLPLSLNFEATLHRAESGPHVFQPKTAKLIIKGKKLKSSAVSAAKAGTAATWPVQVLGSLTLQLHQLAVVPLLDETSPQTPITGIAAVDSASDMSSMDTTFSRFVLEQCSYPGSNIHASVTVSSMDSNNAVANNSTAPNNDTTLNNYNTSLSTTTSTASTSKSVSSGSSDLSSPPPVPSTAPPAVATAFDSFFDPFPPTQPPPLDRDRDKGRERDSSDPFRNAPSYAGSGDSMFGSVDEDPFADLPSPPQKNNNSANTNSTIAVKNEWDDSSFAEWTPPPTHPRSHRSNSKAATEEVARLQQEVQALQTVLASQELKMQQAADYVAYQEHCLAGLTAQLQVAEAEKLALYTQLQQQGSEKGAVSSNGSSVGVGEASNSSSGDSSGDASRAEVEQLLEKLRQAKEFIDYQAEQIELLQEIPATPSPQDSSAAVVRLQQQLEQQEQVLQALQEQLAERDRQAGMRDDRDRQTQAASLAGLAAAVSRERQLQRDLDVLQAQPLQSAGDPTQQLTLLLATYTSSSLNATAAEDVDIQRLLEEIQRVQVWLQTQHPALAPPSPMPLQNSAEEQKKQQQQQLLLLEQQKLQQERQERQLLEQRLTQQQQEHQALLAQQAQQLTAAQKHQIQLQEQQLLVTQQQEQLRQQEQQLAEMDEKLQQAKAFIDYQAEQIAAPAESGCSGCGDSAAKLQQAKEFIDYQSELLEQEKQELQQASQEMERLKVQLLMATEAVDSVLRKSQILCVMHVRSHSEKAATPAHFFVSSEAKLRSVEGNLDLVGEVLSQQSQQLLSQSDELSQLKQQLQQLQQLQQRKEREEEDDVLQLANIYPSPSEDGAASEPGHRALLFPSASSDDRQDFSPSHGRSAELMYSQLESRLREKEADLLGVNALLDQLNMNFQLKAKALDACSAQLNCFRQVLQEVVEKVFQLRSASPLASEQRSELVAAMQQAIPSSSWISQQLLAAIQALCSQIQQHEVVAASAQRTQLEAQWAAERAEKDGDMEKLLRDLIDAKMTLANTANDCEEYRNVVRQLRRQLRQVEGLGPGSPLSSSGSVHSSRDAY